MNTAIDAAFLAEIIAHRDDDTPRLIYADWLEEQGRELRAEFIRVQVKLADMALDDWRPSEPEYKVQQALRRRERKLLAGTVEALQFPPLRSWYAAYGPAGGPFTHRWVGEPLAREVAVAFRRGFVADINVCAADWLEFADALCACAPLEEVTLTTWPVLHWDGPGRVSFSGREWGDVSPGYDEPYAAEVRRLLREKWPDFEFHLPAPEQVEAPAVRRIPRPRRS